MVMVVVGRGDSDGNGVNGGISSLTDICGHSGGNGSDYNGIGKSRGKKE